MLTHTFACLSANDETLTTSDASFSVTYLFAQRSLLEADCEVHCIIQNSLMQKFKMWTSNGMILFFSDYFPLFDDLSTSKDYKCKFFWVPFYLKPGQMFSSFHVERALALYKLQHVFSWLWNDVSKTCWCYR